MVTNDLSIPTWWRRAQQFRITGYIVAGLIILTMIAALAPFQESLSSTTVSLILLLGVLLTATVWGSAPAYLASVLAVLGFNFFFLPPVGTFHIADQQNWIALFVFLMTSLVVGNLSAQTKRRAAIAEARSREVERLYAELKSAFELASEAEALRRSEQLKTALLDAVTHDLRTPLTSIKMSVTTLLAERKSPTPPALDDEGENELLEVINQETDRLNHFIEGMVELARIEAGDLQMRRNWGAIDDIIETSVTRADPLLSRHRLEIQLDRELPSVRADNKALTEVVYTLLDNAAKYSPPGTTILITARSPDEDLIEVAVTDEGRGIPRELRDRVFDKFFRVKSTDGPVGGIGMGLAIARGIVEAHGGRIRIEDGPSGRGTRVVFTIPVGDLETAIGYADNSMADSVAGNN
ncbi:MAG: ATP-binding protein [Blastocatellales bacterium]